MTEIEDLRAVADRAIDAIYDDLWAVSQDLHQHPEVAYQEHRAVKTICDFLEQQSIKVKRGSYGIETSFEAEYGSGGRLVIFCAEYDALLIKHASDTHPAEIAHACGHNLIAASGVGAFLGAVAALKSTGKPGRLRLLGTPAEEGGGGKCKLLDAGAFPSDVAASIMAHPVCAQQLSLDPQEYAGLAGWKLVASYKFKSEFFGKGAHAAGEPWNGRNALDAAVLAYSSAGLMRQQIRPEERIQAVFEVGGTVPNIIPDYTRISWNLRARDLQSAESLALRVHGCIAAAAQASGCSSKIIPGTQYTNLTANRTLCEAFAKDMQVMGLKFQLRSDKAMSGSTDMGNVSHDNPSFHCAFAIPADPDVSIHNPRFAEAAGRPEAHKAAMNTAKGMSMLGIRALFDDEFAKAARDDFENNHSW